jgi:hypothetical protein
MGFLGIALRLELTNASRVKLDAAGTTAVSLPPKLPAEAG